MTIRSIHTNVRSWSTTAAILVTASAASADLYINSDLATISGSSGTAAGAGYRMSNSNWDMSLNNGLGTAKSANFISANLGNNKQLSESAYAFSLTHLSGQGFIWQLTNMETGKTTTEAWGAFDSDPGGTVKSVLNGLTPGAAFNTILIEARATSSGSSMEFSNLAFNSGLTVADGALVSGAVMPGKSGPGNLPGYWNQTIASTTNLADEKWSLTGIIRGQRSGSSGDEEVRFTINMREGSVSVPGPAGFALLGMAALLSRAGSRRSDRD